MSGSSFDLPGPVTSFETLTSLAALRGAKAKPLGDAWAWSRKGSSGDVAAVVALTIALAVGSEIPVGPTEIAIY